jgi:cysteinyl-tRNA synthetase
MSKSLKNFISIDDALQKYSARQLRLAFLFQSWSSKMDFSEAAMVEVGKAEKQFDNFFITVKTQLRSFASKGPSYSDGLHHYGQGEKDLIAALTGAQLEFRKALCDSFDTPGALRILQNLVSAANVYEKEKRQGLNASVLETVARWVGEMLRMFGLGVDGLRESEIGWGEAGSEGAGGGAAGSSAGSSIDRESLLLPYLEALSSFRSSVRQLARSNAPSSELLKLADRLRDEDLVDLGVRLEDLEGASGSALVKLVPAEQLRAERDEKLRMAEEKAKRKEVAARQAAQARAERLRKGRVPPALLFKPSSEGGLAAEGEYAGWDEAGLPTVDGKTGEELSKSRKKAVLKELAQHTKLHEEYLAAREKGEVE